MADTGTMKMKKSILGGLFGTDCTAVSFNLIKNSKALFKAKNVTFRTQLRPSSAKK